MCKGEGDAFKAGRNNIDSVTTVAGEGRAKVVGTVPVWIPRETVVGAVKRQDKVDRGSGKGGRRSRRKMMESRPNREREGSGRQGRMRLRVSSAWGRRRSQRSAGKSGWVEAKMDMR